MRMSLKIVNKKVKLVETVELVCNVVKNGNVSVGSTNMLICHICVFVADPRQIANVLSRFSHVSMWYVHMYSHYTGSRVKLVRPFQLQRIIAMPHTGTLAIGFML